MLRHQICCSYLFLRSLEQVWTSRWFAEINKLPSGSKSNSTDCRSVVGLYQHELAPPLSNAIFFTLISCVHENLWTTSQVRWVCWLPYEPFSGKSLLSTVTKCMM